MFLTFWVFRNKEANWRLRVWLKTTMKFQKQAGLLWARLINFTQPHGNQKCLEQCLEPDYQSPAWTSSEVKGAWFPCAFFPSHTCSFCWVIHRLNLLANSLVCECPTSDPGHFPSRANMAAGKATETSLYGHVGQFSLIIPYFAEENTTWKNPTDSCYAKCKGWVKWSSLQPCVQYLPNISHCKAQIKFTACLQMSSFQWEIQHQNPSKYISCWEKKVSDSVPKCFVHVFPIQSFSWICTGGSLSAPQETCVIYSSGFSK